MGIASFRKNGEHGKTALMGSLRQHLNKATRYRHTLSADEKHAYIDAELCVMGTPAKTNLPGAKTRFDELVSSHQIQALLVHSTGVFLPFHRYLLHAHHTFLRDCGYTGVIPYV